MAQVPYSPVPDVAPSDIATPRVSVATPEAAFGGATAKAIENLGTTVQGAGNELFGRAVALQQLNNETEAKQADADYMIAAGDVHAKFNALEGKDRVDAYPGYVKQLEDLRVKGRNGLSNAMAQRMFDSSSLSTMSRSIFNGAGAAAAANHQWQIGTATSQIDLDAKTVEDNPKDEGLFQQKLQRVHENAGTLAGLKGFDPDGPEAKDLALKATSKLWTQRIIGLSRTDPFTAANFLDQNKTQLTQDDYLKVDAAVRSQGRAVGSVNIANETYDPKKPLAQMEQEATDKAKALSPDDPIMATHAVAALRAKYNQDKYATSREQYSNEQLILGALQKGVQNDQQLFADPQIKAAYDALPPTSTLKKKPINYEIQQYNTERDKQVMDENWVRLRGQASNDVKGFLDTNIPAERLAPDKRDRLIALREKLIQNQDADPRVQKSVGILRGAMGAQLEALGIFKRTEANKDDYDHFTGTLQTALDTWQETHGKPATAKDITETIGPQVIRQRTEPGFFNIGGVGTTNQVPFFKQTVPDDFAAIARREAQNPNLPDEQIYKLYLKYQYNNLYGPKKTQ